MDFATALRRTGKSSQVNTIKTTKPIVLTGGLNVMQSPMVIPAGELMGCVNYEPSIVGGYRRFDGYERFDGRASPTDAPYLSLAFLSGAFNPAVGSAITESGSGAAGVVVYVDTPNLTVVIVNITGTFAGSGSTLTSDAMTTASSGAPNISSGITQALSNSYYYQKWLYFQALIGTVGASLCSGPVLGVWPHANNVFAFRNNAAGTQALMFKATTTGWAQITFGTKIYYTAGIYSASMTSPPEGTVLTGFTSGATFTIQRVQTASGTWGTNAAGFFITNAITGTPVAGELLKVAGVTYATYASLLVQTLPPNGTYFFRSHNFEHAQTPATGFRLYGVNGVGNGFEYDSVAGVMTLIESATSPDIPDHLEIHSEYLFYSYAGGTLQNSGYQLPLNWNPVFGADARSVGEDVTFLREDVSQTLVIGTRRRLWVLTGLQLEQFQIRVYSSNTGAYENTDEVPGQIIFAEDRGITSVAAAAQYGDFEATSLSDNILSLLTAKLITDTPIGAIMTRKKNLYRLIFASGDVLCLAMNAGGKFAGWTPGSYMNVPSCAFAGFWQNANGLQIERAFLGCADGYVRELDKGRSFDGQTVTHFLKLAYTHLGSPDTFKRFRRVQIDILPEGASSIFIGADCDYGNRTGQTSPITALAGGGGLWDVAIWDQFIWDAPTYTGQASKLELEGYNISLTISGAAVNDTPFTATGISYQYSPRIINRNSQEA